MIFNLKDIPCLVALHNKLDLEGKENFKLDQLVEIGAWPSISEKDIYFFKFKEWITTWQNKKYISCTLNYLGTTREGEHYWSNLYTSLLKENISLYEILKKYSIVNMLDSFKEIIS